MKKIVKNNIPDISVESLTELIVNAVLEERYFDKQNLTPKIKVILKEYHRAKKKPNYGKNRKPEKMNAYIHTIEQKEFELQFTKDWIRENFPNTINSLFDKMDIELRNRGFIN